MQYLAVCTFELKAASDAQYEIAYAALDKLGFRHSTPANEPGLELPSDAVVGVFDVSARAPQGQVAFLRNCLSFKLREVFQRFGLDAEFLLVVSQGDLAWERGGYDPADFAARHGRGAMAVTAVS
jgi:hypothetical protein